MHRWHFTFRVSDRLRTDEIRGPAVDKYDPTNDYTNIPKLADLPSAVELAKLTYKTGSAHRLPMCRCCWCVRRTRTRRSVISDSAYYYYCYNHVITANDAYDVRHARANLYGDKIIGNQIGLDYLLID